MTEALKDLPALAPAGLVAERDAWNIAFEALSATENKEPTL